LEFTAYNETYMKILFLQCKPKNLSKRAWQFYTFSLKSMSSSAIIMYTPG